jgi:hypothetical protein
MTVHVARADEGKGRVILRLSAWKPNELAIEAAMTVASAFHSEVEVLFVEDSQRVDFAGFPFARETSLRGGAPRAVSARAVRAEFQGAFAVARRRIAEMACEADVPIYEHTVRDEPVQALASACARRGPWNMIAIAETFGAPAPFSIDEVFDNVTDATGVIIAGPAARGRNRTNHSHGLRQRKGAGPVVLAVEDVEHLQSMLRAGRFIGGALDAEVVMLLVAGTDEEYARMDSEVRLVLADQDHVRFAHAGVTYDDQAAVAEAIRRLDSGFLIAQYGGVTAPRANKLRPLMCALPCPVLLVR